jgi:hypothetical protein
MNTKFALTVATLAGIAIGGTAVQGLHAQNKPKAYLVNEYDGSDANMQKYLAEIRPLVEKVGKPLYTGMGKVTGIIGDAPKHVGLVEWNSTEDAVNFVKEHSDVPAKNGVKVLRRYVVEATQ